MEFEQISIFDLFDDSKAKPFKINKPVRLIEAFGGIGAQALALEVLGVPFTHHRLIEFDKYPVKSYNAIHHTDFEPTDIRDVHGKDLGITEKDKYCYIFTYSFPCQDISVAGLGKGFSKENQMGENATRSGLLWEVERILTELQVARMDKPDVLVMENVPAIHSSKNIKDFEQWLAFLESIGYTNFWQDLNAADFGIPQSRNRTFCVSLLGNYDYKFPEPIELKATMRDYLDAKVDDKYYIKSDRAKKLIDQLFENGTLPISR